VWQSTSKKREPLHIYDNSARALVSGSEFLIFYRFRDVLVHLLMQYDLKLYSYTRRLRNIVVLTLAIQTASRKLNSNKITKGYT